MVRQPVEECKKIDGNVSTRTSTITAATKRSTTSTLTDTASTSSSSIADNSSQDNDSQNGSVKDGFSKTAVLFALFELIKGLVLLIE